MRGGKPKPLAIDHHPSAQLLSDYLIANLSPGVALAVGAHLDLCAACRLAGAALAGSAAHPDTGASWSEADTHAAPWPTAVRHACAESWSPMRKGVEGSHATHVSGLGEFVYLLRALPGADIGAASLSSAFVVLVTAGALDLDGRRFRAGDLVELAAPPASAVADRAAGASLLVVADESPRRLRGARPGAPAPRSR
ncbi:hypothetical protein [Phenylobacterium sp.]|uniref:hypothetical protein n=1 Tax=Phenylobacterium sp. TaxID=1871053 RepID=UPI002C66ED14|nr:hypothetical protein [Phenylobacterium sp.]HVI31075.1 hypothetical protein [Phenylobacterium sp.]